jgi:hypothetical protein
MELIHPSSTAKNESVTARVRAATSAGECVPADAWCAVGLRFVFREVFTELTLSPCVQIGFPGRRLLATLTGASLSASDSLSLLIPASTPRGSARRPPS